MQTALAFITGLFAGLVHVWSGPDHLAAVAPLSLQRVKRACSVGLRWGLGHSIGVLLIGIVALSFREALPLNSISSTAERLVGIVLIGIGIWGMRKAFAHRVHSHPHTHGEGSHTHFHVHDPKTAHEPAQNRPHVHTHAAFAVGTLHGIAGSSHFIAVLPALAFPGSVAAVAYLIGYAAGAIAGMAGFSSALAWLQRAISPLPRGEGQGEGQTGSSTPLMCACSCAALAVGLYWLC